MNDSTATAVLCSDCKSKIKDWNRESSERETGVHATQRKREREREREIRNIIFFFFFFVNTFVWLLRKFEGKCLGE